MHFKADSELQNLLYERRYYEQEIALCRGFVSKHSDADVGLQTIEVFWEQADADLKDKASNTSDVTDAMEEEGGLDISAADLQRKEHHILMLARLEHEMRMRRKLASDLDSLKKKRAHVQQKVQSKERTYKAILTTIQDVETAAAPLQAYVDPSAPPL